MIAVVVVGDDTYYWVYLSSDHRFQVYCKVRQLIYYKVQQVLLECDRTSLHLSRLAATAHGCHFPDSTHKKN